MVAIEREFDPKKLIKQWEMGKEVPMLSKENPMPLDKVKNLMGFLVVQKSNNTPLQGKMGLRTLKPLHH